MNKRLKSVLLGLLGLALFSITSLQASDKKLIYVMDPHCGWCYGNHENLEKIHDAYAKKIDLELVVAGMWVRDGAPVGGNKLVKFIKAHTPKIVEKTGVTIDQKYYDLAANSSYVFSSLEPSAAIIVAKELKPNVVFEFSKKVQEAIFIHGKRLDKYETYKNIVTSFNIDEKRFKAMWMSKDNVEKTEAEFKRASTISFGYPSLFIEKDGKTSIIAAGEFNVADIMDILEEELAN